MTHASCTMGEFVQACFYSVDGVHWLLMYSAHACICWKQVVSL